MQLGAFSISLTVKDLAKSKAFYEKLGFDASGGTMEHNYLIMKNGTTVIGLFQGMFDENILTFNPGWDNNAQEVNPFTDVRELQKSLEADGVELLSKAEGEEGPAHIVFVDPDGNPIMIDQHR